MLREQGHGAWVVGGCVRDHLLGRAVSDWDLCTSARPDEVVKCFRRVIPTGIAHGTVTVLCDTEKFEVTTLRGEGEYTDGRHPDSVRFLRDVNEDLARRDFTVNAMAFEPVEGELIDPFGGVRDLGFGLLRAVGDPAKRFGEDGLRVLRGARFVASLEFELEPETERAMAGAIEVFRRVSAERVRDEFVKTLRARQPSRGLEVMRRVGVTEVVCPGFDAVRWAEAMSRVDRIEGDGDGGGGALRRLAAMWLGGPVDAVKTWMKRYKFSTHEAQFVTHLVGLFPWNWCADPAQRRRSLVKAGRHSVGDVAALLRSSAEVSVAREVEDFFREESQAIPFVQAELAVRGEDVMQALSIGPSRALGDALKALHTAAIDDPTVNTREGLLAVLAQCFREREK